MSKLLEQIKNTKTTKKLGDLVLINQSSITNGFSYREIEYIDTASVTRNHFNRPQILNINEAPSRAKRLLKDGDTILSTVRPSLCHYGFIKNPKPNTVASTGFAVLTPKNIDPFYLYSYLTQDSITATLSSIAEATTTTFPAFRPEVLSEMEIEIPDLPTQKKIAEILSAYDTKIENNNKIIKNLEATAQAIFNEWFINFRFPGYEKVKMVESEMGEIPKGWSIKKVSELFTVTLGGTPSRDKSEYWSGKIPWINSGEVNKLRIIEATEHITDEGLRKSNARLMNSGTTVLAITGATLGQVSRLEIESSANQSVVGVYDEENKLNEYMFLYIKSNIMDLILGASGGAQQHINKQMVENYKITLPGRDIILKFTKVVNPMFKLIRECLFENKNLKESRDQLLVKLI